MWVFFFLYFNSSVFENFHNKKLGRDELYSIQQALKAKSVYFCCRGFQGLYGLYSSRGGTRGRKPTPGGPLPQLSVTDDVTKWTPAPCA